MSNHHELLLKFFSQIALTDQKSRFKCNFYKLIPIKRRKYAKSMKC